MATSQLPSVFLWPDGQPFKHEFDHLGQLIFQPPGIEVSESNTEFAWRQWDALATPTNTVTSKGESA